MSKIKNETKKAAKTEVKETKKVNIYMIPSFQNTGNFFDIFVQTFIFRLIDEIRLKMPDELKQARWVKEERQRIINEAQAEAEKIIKGAVAEGRAQLTTLESIDVLDAYGSKIYGKLKDLAIAAGLCSIETDKEIAAKVDTALKLKGIVADSEEVINAFDTLTVKNAKNKGCEM